MAQIHDSCIHTERQDWQFGTALQHNQTYIQSYKYQHVSQGRGSSQARLGWLGLNAGDGVYTNEEQLIAILVGHHCGLVGVVMKCYW